jgi:hypothetical protein
MQSNSPRIIYFDHNAALDVMHGRNEDLAKAVLREKSSGSRFVYSPAHMEEIAFILRQAQLSDEECERHTPEHIQFFSDFTDNWEFLPAEGEDPTVLKQEHPGICYGRVIDGYEWTYFAEGVSETLRDLVNVPRPRATPIDAFEEKQVATRFGFRRGVFSGGGDPPYGAELRRTHKTAERWIDIAFRSLEEAGFDLEAKKKNRSAIHDVSHAIYGSRADIFVSGDKKLLRKSKATFHMLKAQTRVMSVEEFMEFVRQQ